MNVRELKILRYPNRLIPWAICDWEGPLYWFLTEELAMQFLEMTSRQGDETSWRTTGAEIYEEATAP